MLGVLKYATVNLCHNVIPKRDSVLKVDVKGHGKDQCVKVGRIR